MARGTNLLVIMADEYNPKAFGHCGHPVVKTPNIDRLAVKGTRFRWAYTPSPICCPARAAFHTGLLPHQTGYWDNCLAYDGRISGWQHRLQLANHPVSSIGKLHFRSDEDPIGFDRRILPMHIHGKGDIQGLVRNDPPLRPQSRKLAESAGPGDTPYVEYDRDITTEACKWLLNVGGRMVDKKWVLFVSFACPHFPLIPPGDYYDLYLDREIAIPKRRDPKGWPRNEWWRAFEHHYAFDRFFLDDQHRRKAIASYFALCSFVDHNIGEVLRALEQADLARDTRVIFTSDHGDNLGARGLWGKSTMYEESVGIPLIMAGPDIPINRVALTPVSLIDLYPTILDCLGASPYEGNKERQGASLFDFLERPDDLCRMVFSEYHAAGATSAEFMLRRGRYKYMHYVGFEPELYDLQTDPEEIQDLSEMPQYKGLLREFEAYLWKMLDPVATDRKAKADQALLVEKLGGIDAVRKHVGNIATPVPLKSLGVGIQL